MQRLIFSLNNFRSYAVRSSRSKMLMAVSSEFVSIILVSFTSLTNCFIHVCGGLPCFLFIGFSASFKLLRAGVSGSSLAR